MNRNRLIKLAMGVAALVITGEGYLVLEELQQARRTGEQLIQVIQLTAHNLDRVARLQTKLNQNVSNSTKNINSKINRAKVICGKADTNISTANEKLGNIEDQLKKLTKRVEKLGKWR